MKQINIKSLFLCWNVVLNIPKSWNAIKLPQTVSIKVNIGKHPVVTMYKFNIHKPILKALEITSIQAVKVAVLIAFNERQMHLCVTYAHVSLKFISYEI